MLVVALLLLGLSAWQAASGFRLVFHQLHYVRQAPFAIAPEVDGSLFLQPRWQMDCGLPLGCHVRDAPPYDLSLQLWDPTRAALRLSLAEIRVEQAGAPPRRLTGGWSWALREVMHHISGPGPDAVPEMRLDAVIPAVVPLPADVTLTLTGRLEHRGGAVTPFRVTERFAIRARRSSYSLGEVIEAIMSGA